jgi:hypothetical protein
MTIDDAIGNLVTRVKSLESEGSAVYSLLVITDGTSGESVSASIANGETVTGTFDSNGQCILKLSYVGKYTILLGNLAIRDINIPAMYSVITTHLIPSFNDATWDEISKLLDLHYNGDIDLTNYWKVGDVKENVSLINTMSDVYDSVTHSLQEIDLVIIGTNHDTISDNGKKAVFTIAQKDCLGRSGRITNYDSGYTYARYSVSSRNSWMTTQYIYALPFKLQRLIKRVNKFMTDPQSLTEAPATTILSSTAKCFIPSCYEVFGEGYTFDAISNKQTYTYGVNISDGTQYEYYKTEDNIKRKLGKNNDSYIAWYTRSGFMYSEKPYFVTVGLSGLASYNVPTNSLGICPHFCI